MKVCVTGAAGFLGRHVYHALTSAGHTVISLDFQWEEPLTSSQASHTIMADITKPLRKIDGLDAVIHLAAVASPRECDSDPTKAFDVNVNGTMQVLRMALESGAKKVVFSSTGHVYNIPPLYQPTDETHPLRLNNTYTTSKILGEQLCELFWDNHGLEYTTLRLFNVYGEGQRPGYFIPDQLAKAKTGRIELRGANTTKDWVYVDDVVQAFVKALDTNYVGAVNIGTGIETELKTIGEFIADAARCDFTQMSDPNPTRMCADIRRAERVLGWRPEVRYAQLAALMAKTDFERISQLPTRY